ncbi:MAG TPA: helix-turn-helix transcriptional regulator [Pyrinomonadaceae bacterium]|nr:helix-turn-helix transcriptional regulator [Pyrinomonadaceae bacterium]
MGKYPRERPDRLTAKLKQIRESLGLSQSAMLNMLGMGETRDRSSVSSYELGTSEPPLPILLQYARLAGVCMDLIVDDELDLPQRLPSTPKHRGPKTAASRQRESKR